MCQPIKFGCILGVGALKNGQPTNIAQCRDNRSILVVFIASRAEIMGTRPILVGFLMILVPIHHCMKQPPLSQLHRPAVLPHNLRPRPPLPRPPHLRPLRRVDAAIPRTLRPGPVPSRIPLAVHPEGELPCGCAAHGGVFGYRVSGEDIIAEGVWGAGA